MRKGNVYTSDFYCTCCGRKGIGVPRIKGRDRERGHLKRLYCCWCKKETNHVEIRGFGQYTKRDFDLEFEYGNFDKEGNRIMKYGEFKHKLRMEGLLNG